MEEKRDGLTTKYSDMISSFEKVLADNPNTIFCISDIAKYLKMESVENLSTKLFQMKRTRSCVERLMKYPNYSEYHLKKYIFTTYGDEIQESWINGGETTSALVTRLVNRDPKIKRWYNFTPESLRRNLCSSRTTKSKNVPRRIRTRKAGEVAAIFEEIVKDVKANPFKYSVTELVTKYGISYKTGTMFFKYRAEGKALQRYVRYSPRETETEIANIRWLKKVNAEIESGLTIEELYPKYGFERASDLTAKISQLSYNYRS